MFSYIIAKINTRENIHLSELIYMIILNLYKNMQYALFIISDLLLFESNDLLLFESK